MGRLEDACAERSKPKSEPTRQTKLVCAHSPEVISDLADGGNSMRQETMFVHVQKNGTRAPQLPHTHEAATARRTQRNQVVLFERHRRGRSLMTEQ